ncbi:hypothetical protein VNO80_22145 [Phaseolus coccineus]|uniref:Uncharacterized protein n=1 Tax=Phaseolus coccineus TaxID=3886 RepID=A0AAN9M4J2_PHACN
MEFKFRDGENRSFTTLSPQQRPLTNVPSVSGHGHPLRGGFPSPGGFPGSGGFRSIIPSSPRVYPTSVPINAEEAIRREMVREQIRRELEKEEIRREILAGEMAWRRDLEEEVRRELASERALRMPMQRMEGVAFGEGVFSLSMNPRMRLNNPDHSINISGGPQPQLAPKVDITQFNKQMPNETLTNQDKVIKLAKPNADLLSLKCKEVLDVNVGSAKRKLVTPFPGDDNHAGSSLQKKPKKEWSCALCQIVATSEKGLNDHLQGKKHKVKAASLTTKKMGLDARQDGETLGSGISPVDKDKDKVELSALCQVVATSEKDLNDHLQGKKHKVKAASLTTQKMGLDARQDGETLGSGISPEDKGKVELIKMDLAVQKSHDSGGIDTENEATTEKEVLKTKALTTRKKFEFLCAYCQVRTQSEVVMESHKSGKKHLANITKLNPNNSAGASAATNPE